MAHLPCPHCGSSDGVQDYENGTSFHCFVCQKTWKIGGTESMSDSMPSNFKDESWEKCDVEPITTKVRGISPEIYSQYDYYKNEKGIHVINHYDREGRVIAQKFRYKDKTFSWKGNPKLAVPFGMGRWRSGGKRITITEGELDALSVAEALGGKYPVISVNNGAQSAKKDLKEHIEFLNSYDEITLAFDNDEAGKKAIQECSQLFEAGKVTVVNLGKYKDFNEVLQEEGRSGVLRFYYETQKYTPSGIVNASSINYDDLMAIDSAHSFTTPYSAINTKLKGVRKGELLTVVAGSGLGKSTFVREIAYDLLMKHELTVGYVALEENNKRSALGFLSIHTNTPLYLDDVREQADKDQVRKAYDDVIGTDRLYLYNHFGSLDSDSLLSKLRYLIVGAGCDFLILDHISIVVSGLQDMGDNERRTIDVLMTKLRSLVEETGCGMIIVSHLKRPDGNKGHEDGLRTSLSHLRGSAAIAQLSDGVIGLERDQQGTRPDVATVRVLKNRYTGEVGEAGHIQFFKEQGRLVDSEAPPKEEGFVNENTDF